jgi:hypothetical protein
MSTPRKAYQPVVTLAALYGAGGSVVGPRVAERLGVPLLDRAIPETVAAQTGLSEEAVADVDEEPRGRLARVFDQLGRASGPLAANDSAARLDVQERALRARIEEFLVQSSVHGGVTVGRGGAVVLSDVPWALHVLLGGPLEARLQQRIRLEGIDHETAASRQKVNDGSRISYVRRAYGVEGTDPSLYHLVLDSTAIDLDTCVELIVTASRARLHDPRPVPKI